MSFSNKPHRHSIISVASLVVLATIQILPAHGQVSNQDRFNHAVALYNTNALSDAEKACDIMKQLVQEAPTSSEYQNARNRFCNDVDSIHATERRNADEGIRLAKSGKCRDAKAHYDRIATLGTRDSKYRDQLKRELDACGSSGPTTDQIAQGQINQATQLFQNGNDAAARAILRPLASGGGSLAQQANQLLTRIAQAQATDRGLINEAQILISQGRKSDARSRLQIVIQRRGPDSANARQILNQLGGSTSDEALRAGIRAYFNGDLARAETDLTSYLRASSDPNALFFRGAARCSLFFLSGETDTSLKNSAAADFQLLKQRYKAFQPPLQYISPKIRDLYYAQ